MKRRLSKSSDHKAVLSLRSITLKKRASLPCSQRSMERGQFVAGTPGWFPLFQRFCSSKKIKKENKDAEAGPYCFLQTKPRYLFKNNTDINKHPNIHIPQSQSHGQSAREQSHAPPQLLLLEFQFSHVPHPTGEKSHLIL